MANPDILITPGQGTIGFSGTNTGTIQLRVAESGDIHFEGDQGSLLSLSDDLSDSLFSVNDAAGMPVFEVFADDTIKAYRNNEAKLEIDPDNNRIRLRDNAFISGDSTVSGESTVLGSLYLERRAYHRGDHSTFIDFTPGQIDFETSSTNGIRLRNNTYVSGSLFITGQEAIYLRTSASSTRIRSDQQINFLTEGGSAQMARFKKIQVSTNYSATADFNDNGIVFGTDANLFRSAANTLKTDGNLVVIGDMTVSGDLTSASASHEATSYTASTHVSGTSGYFGKMGIGYSDNFHPDARLVVGQNPTNGFAIIAGSDNAGVAPQISNSQTKVVRIGMPHYTITEEPVTLMTATSSSSKTDIHIGGGTAYGNSIENMYLRTAASHTTTKGTTALYINNNQEVLVGPLGGLTTAAGLGAALTVSGDASITGTLTVGGGQSAESIKLIRSSDTSPFMGWYSNISTREAYIQGSTSHFYIVNQNNNNIELMTNGAVNFTVSPTATISRQKVGIGTTNPAELLTISGANPTVRINSPTTAGSDTAAYTFGFNANADLAGMRLDHSDRVVSGLSLFVHPAYGYPISVTPSPNKDIFLNVMDGGGVGIGTNDALALLTVGSRMASGPTSQIYLDVHGSNTVGGGGELIFNTSASAGDLTNFNAKIRATRNSQNDGSADLTFLTSHVPTAQASAVRMTIKSDGNVGIGTDNPGPFKLLVSGQNTHTVARFAGPGATTSGSNSYSTVIIGDTDAGSSYGATKDSTFSELQIRARNDAGAGFEAVRLALDGYEGRAVGVFFVDDDYQTSKEWFAGMPYGGSATFWQIGRGTTSNHFAKQRQGAILTVRDEAMGGGNGQVLIGGDARGTSQYAGSTLTVSGDTNITGELRVKEGIYVSDGASAGSAYIQLGNSNDYTNFTSAQLHLAGGTNAGFQTVGSRKIFLSDYDNDAATNGVTLFECIDENQNVDIRFLGGSGSSLPGRNYFRGTVGIGTETPTPGDMHSSMGDAKLHVYDSASGVVARFQGGSDANGQHGAILINHSNDRGLLIRGGRGVGNTASGSLGLVGETAQPLGNAGGTIHLRAQTSSINGDVFVGIGTSSPTQLLEVDGNIRLGDGDHRNIIGPTNATLGIYSNPNDVNEGIKFSTDGGSTIEMFLQNGGNVGIGTENPQGVKLHVNGSAIVSGTLYVKNDQIWEDANSTDIIAKLYDNNDDGVFDIYQNNSVVNRIHGNGASYFKGGNVGIGTDNPGRKFMVHGGSARMGIKNSTEGVVLGLLSDDAGYFQLNSADGTTQIQLRADASDSYITGQLGIGTKSPNSALEVFGQVRILDSTATPSYGARLVVGRDTAQCLKFTVDDTLCTITADQDSDSNGNHRFILDRTFDGNGENTFEVRKDGTRQLLIDTDGKVGMGTAEPTGKLHIYQSGDSQPAFLVEGSQGSLFSVEDTLTGSLMSVNDIAGLPVFEAFDDGTIVMGQYNSGDLVVTGNKVGIGTISPEAELHVFNGTAKFEGVDGNDFSLELGRSDNANTWKFNHAGADLRIYNSAGAGSDILLGVDAGGGVIANKVGIAVATPSGKLHVRHNDFTLFENNVAGANLTHKMASHNQIWQIAVRESDKASAYVIRDETAGVDAFAIEKGGNVGIGTTNPSEKLEVINGRIRIVNTAGAQLVLRGDSGNSGDSGEIDGIIDLLHDDETFGYRINTENHSGKTAFHLQERISSAYTSRLYIDQNGNVGIGTSSPDQMLHLKKSSGTTTVLTEVAANSTVGFEIKKTGTGGGATNQHWRIVDGQTVNGRLEFYDVTDSATRMIIDGDGKVGIGTISPATALEVKGDGSLFQVSSNDYDVAILGRRGSSGTNLDKGYLRLRSEGATKVAVDSAGDTFFKGGNVGIGTGSPSEELTLANSSAYAALELRNDGTVSNGTELGRVFANDGAGNYFAGIKMIYHDSNDGEIRLRYKIAGTNTDAVTFVDGHVGIGDTSPDYTLTVNAGTTNEIARFKSTDNDALISISDNTDTVYVGLDASADIMSLGFSNSFASTNLSIDTAGKVGIGTTAPTKTLHVRYSTDNSSAILADGLPGGAAGKGILINNVATNVNSFANLDFRANDADGRIAYTYEAANQGSFHFIADNSSAPAIAMTIKSNANVGIGTTLPSGRLHVENDSTGIIVANDQITGNAFEVFGAQGNLLTVTDDLSDSLFSVNDAAGMPVFEVFADDTIKSYRNNESKLEVDPDNNRVRLRDNAFVSGNIIASGSVGIGTTGPSTLLHIRKTSLTDDSRNALLLLDGKFTAGSINAGDEVGIAFNVENAGGGSQQTTSITSSYQPSHNSLNLQPAGGKVAIGTTDPDSLLTVHGDAQISGHIRAGAHGKDGMRMGHWEPADGYGYLQNEALDPDNADNYAVLQSNNGNTYINAADGRTLFLRVENATEYDSEFTASGVLWNRGGLPNADFAIRGDNNNVFKVDAGDEYVDLQTAKLKIGGTGLAGGFLKCTNTSTATVEYATLSWSDLPAISTLAEI